MVWPLLTLARAPDHGRVVSARSLLGESERYGVPHTVEHRSTARRAGRFRIAFGGDLGRMTRRSRPLLSGLDGPQRASKEVTMAKSSGSAAGAVSGRLQMGGGHSQRS